MLNHLDGLAIFSTEKNGYNKDEAGRHLAKTISQYENLRKFGLCLLAICAVLGVMLVLVLIKLIFQK